MLSLEFAYPPDPMVLSSVPIVTQFARLEASIHGMNLYTNKVEIIRLPLLKEKGPSLGGSMT